MWLDFGAIAIVLIYGMIGLFQGIIVQIFRLIGLVLIFFYAWFVTEPVGEWLAVHLGLNPLPAYYLAFVGGALIIYAGCVLAGRGIHKMSGSEEKPQTLDRVLGCALGLVKGAVVAFLLVSMLDVIPAERYDNWPWFQRQMQQSGILPRVHPYNPLPHLRFLAEIEDFKKVVADREALELMRQQPACKSLESNAKVRAALTDPQLRQLVDDRRWPEVMVNEKVLACVFDRDVRNLVNQLHPKLALEEAARARQKSPK